MAGLGKVRGTEKVIANLDKYGDVFVAMLKNHIKLTTVLVEGAAVKSIQRGPKTGRVYKRGNIAHVASAPGQPPATDQGDLASSVDHKLQSDGLAATVFTKLPYGKHLELGTSKIRPRPWLFPALESSREFYERGVRTVADKAAASVKRK